MTKLRNELPIAVHVASGGDARVRVGGDSISLDGVATGSFQLSGATRFRGYLNTRTTGGSVLLMGYTSPVTVDNADFLVVDLGQFEDNVRDGATVYFTLANPDDMSPYAGGAHDIIHVSFYG